MEAFFSKFGWAVLTILIVFVYGLLMRAFMQKITARVARRRGIPIYQLFVDILKAFSSWIDKVNLDLVIL